MFFVREKPPHTPHKQPNRGNLTYYSPPFGGGAGGGASWGRGRGQSFRGRGQSYSLPYSVTLSSPTLLPCLLLPTVPLSLSYPV